jgi:hypothetical protein
MFEGKPGGQIGGLKGQCNNFMQGKCFRIRCKYQHMLPDSEVAVKLLEEKALFPG